MTVEFESFWREVRAPGPIAARVRSGGAHQWTDVTITIDGQAFTAESVEYSTIYNSRHEVVGRARRVR